MILENNIKNIEKIYVRSFPITLTQFLKWCGAVLTGSEAKELVRCGYVLLNGEECAVPGRQLHPGDIITLLGDEDEGEESISYQAVEQL